MFFVGIVNLLANSWLLLRHPGVSEQHVDLCVLATGNCKSSIRAFSSDFGLYQLLKGNIHCVAL